MLPDVDIIFQYLAMYKIERQPKNILIFLKYVQKIGKHSINPQPFDKDSLNVVKVAKFRQIWSHFRLQRSAVWIQSLAKFILNVYCQLYCIEKTKIKENEAGKGPFLKSVLAFWASVLKLTYHDGANRVVHLLLLKRTWFRSKHF